MPWPAPALALFGAAATVLTTRRILRALPEPDPLPPEGKLPYASLATPSFHIVVGLASLVTGFIAFVTAPWTHWLAWAALTTVGALSCTIDARTTWLPLPLARAGWVIAAAGASVVAITAGSWTPLLASALGALALALPFHLLWRFTGAFGYGDVRLAGTIGAVTALDSPALVGWSLLLGTAASAVVGVAHRSAGGTAGFPYGPGLLAGPFLALLLRLLVA